MIELFSVPQDIALPHHIDNLLHGKQVREFEEEFCDYVGAGHGCSFNSASSAIFMILKVMKQRKVISVPSVIPPVVPNAVINSNTAMRFVDDTEWVGGHYTLATFDNFHLIDAAQEVHAKMFKRFKPEDLVVYSFYPTKPIASIDGGMVVSDDAGVIEYLRKLTLNGTGMAINSWERSLDHIGWKMYMNTLQAHLAHRELQILGRKQSILDHVRMEYQAALFGAGIPVATGNSYHLYRIYVNDQHRFIQEAQDAGIRCGIHYRALHRHPLYSTYAEGRFDKSDFDHFHAVSIPFHHHLSTEDIKTVVDFVLKYREKHGTPLEHLSLLPQS